MLYKESLNLPIPPQKIVFVEVTRLPKAQYNEGMLCKADCTWYADNLLFSTVNNKFVI